MQTSFRLWGIPSVFSWVTSFQTPTNPLSSIHVPAHTTLAKHILLFPVAPRPPCWIPTAVWCTVLLLVAPIAQTTIDKPKFEGSFHQLPEDPVSCWWENHWWQYCEETWSHDTSQNWTILYQMKSVSGWIQIGMEIFEARWCAVPLHGQVSSG